MSIRIKSLVITALILLGFFGLLLLITQIVLLAGLAQLEEKETIKDLQRVLNAISSETAALHSTAEDWSKWDDTYQFVQGTNPDYIKSNLSGGVFSTLKLNVMLFVDTSNRLIYGKAVDLNTGEEVGIPTSLTTEVKPNSRLIPAMDDRDYIAGILTLPEGPLLITSEPILTSLGEGPSAGRLVFGRYLNGEKIQEFSKTTLSPIALYDVHDPHLPSDVLKALSHLSTATTPFIDPIDQDTLAGYGFLNDIHENPALILRIAVDRDIFRQGQSTILDLFIAILITLIVFYIVVWIVMNRMILLRIISLSRTLALIRETKDQNIRLSFEGKDEIADLARGFNEALDTLDLSLASLHTNQELLRTIISSAPLILFAFDIQGKITFLEGTGLQTIGLNRDALIGKSLHDPANEISLFHRDFDAILAHNGQEKTIQIGEVIFDTHYSPLQNSNGEVQGMIGVAVDITEQYQARERLIESEKARLVLEKDKEIHNVKQYFISRMSHQFRTPLAVILATKETLAHYLDRMTPEKRLEKLNVIDEQIQLIVKMMDEVLILSKANLGKLQFAPRRLNLPEFCQHVVDHIGVMDKSQHQLSFSTDGQVGEADVDEQLLQHILGNLLSNAIKYSPNATEITCDLRRQGNDAIIKISDHGIGIPMNDQERLFEAFYRASNTQAIKGTGLGLAIVKESVLLHGGTIICESVQNQGTTFTVRLPITQTQQLNIA